MRIARLHVDGFGALRDTELELPGGLSVVLGPNEAGKSTLLHFCSVMLYGFPRRGHLAYHPPVRGGRHGGTLDVADEGGRIWSIERYAAPSRTLVVHRPDGSEANEHDLHRLLGGSSSELFSSVFAVDLDGLSEVRNVSSEEVREVLFSSAVMGQRRSAAKASRELVARQLEIGRPRGDARANRLAAELVAVRAELAAARAAAGAHAALRSELSGFEAERDSLRERERSLFEEEAELAQLKQLWGRLASGRDAADQLAEMQPLDVAAKRLLECEADIRRAASAFSGYRTRLGQRQDMVRSLDGLDERIRHGLLSLWPEATEEQALSVRHDVATRDALKQMTSSYRTLEARLGDARPAAASASVEAGQAANALAESEALSREVPPPADELDARLRALRELRKRLADRQSIGALAELEEQRTPGRAGRTLSTPGIALVAVGLAILFVAAVAGVTRLPVDLCAGLAAVGSIVVAAGAVLALRRPAPSASRSTRPGGSDDARRSRTSARPARYEDTEGAGGSARDLYRSQCSELDARIAELSTSLSLPSHPTPSDVEIEVERTEVQRARRRELDEAARRCAAAAARARITGDFVDEIEEQLRALDARFLLWKEDVGLPAETGFEAAATALEAVASLQKDVSARRRVEQSLHNVGSVLTAFEATLERLAGDLDEELPTSPDEQEVWLEDLHRRLEEHRSNRQKREALEAAMSRAQAEVERSLGAGQRSEALRRRLADGEVLEWESDLRRIKAELAELRDAEEDVVRRHEALRQRLEDLLQSDRIAELESAEARIEHDLDCALRQYMTLGLARFLISATLERHELERQPEVIRRASEHFARITGGRYVRVTLDANEANRPSMRVRNRSGESVEASALSRGTVEQLYLSLRLGLAEEYAARSVALPIVLDDVLVNFDRERAESVIRDLAATASSHQVIVFTCHDHLAQMIGDIEERTQVVRLERV